MNKEGFQVGDLVEIRNLHKEEFVVGIVIGFKEFSDWSLNRNKYEKTTAVVIRWNSGVETNTSPLVLRKL